MIRLRSESILLLVFTLFLSYLFSMGATFNGVLIPELGFFTLGCTTLLVLAWLYIHWRHHWVWHNTPLDIVFIFWEMAFIIALVTNDDSWRRSLIGLWYVGIYVAIWYFLHDVLANKGVKQDIIVDAFLFAGLIVLFFGYYQLTLVDFDLLNFNFPRPGSTIGNPNALGCFLMILLSIIMGRFLSVQNIMARFVLAVMALASLGLIFFTYSRGAWLGTITSLTIIALLSLQTYGLASFNAIIEWWNHQNGGIKRVLWALGTGVAITALILGFLVIRSLSDFRRDPGLRLGIYSEALTIFAEKPITGHGLFNLGREFMEVESQPPAQPHSHAHNIILHIGAELGIFGLIALSITIVSIFIIMQRGWRQTTGKKRFTRAGFIGAVIGFGVHHLLDIPSMMPAIAIAGLIMLILATAPVNPQPILSQWRRYGHPIAIVGLWFLLLGAGFWSKSVYAEYNDSLKYAILEEDYRGGAERLQNVIDADPYLALYHSQQGYLYGLAANEGDLEAAELGIQAYERFLELEPASVIGMVNLAALYWQDDRQEDAMRLMEHAMEAAPKAWQFFFIAGNYAEAAGDFNKAQLIYKSLLSGGGGYNLMYPEWHQTSFREGIAGPFGSAFRGLPVAVLAIGSGDKLTEQDISDIWAKANISHNWHDSTAKTVSYLLLHLQSNAPQNYEDMYPIWLQQAEQLVVSREDQAWIHLAQAGISRYYDDLVTADQEIEKAKQLLEPSFSRPDFNLGPNIAHFQFLRYTIPRQFLPQVYYPTLDTLPLLYLLDES